MGRPGPGALPQVEKREQYARLIGQGFSSLEACRIVGINPRTGKRWRHGRTITARDGRKLHYSPVVTRGAVVGREISDRYLSERERVQIADLRAAGAGVRAIAERTGRSPSTISRELRRNRDPDSGQYRPFTAHKLAVQRRARPRPGKIAADPVLRQFVADRLEKRWSPQQVSRALPGQFPGERARHVVHETIYQAVYRPELGGLPRELPAGCCAPAVGGAGRTAVRASGGQRDHRDDHDRSAACRGGRAHPAGALGRRPDHRRVQPVRDRHPGGPRVAVHDLAAPARPDTAEAVRDALIAAFCQLPPQLRRSLTWDQGKEMALHAEITAALGMPVYFCEKASPWQRPSNENTNGLLRQYFPKGSDLRVHSAGELAAVAAELNARPRQTLAWGTPAARLGL